MGRQWSSLYPKRDIAGVSGTLIYPTGIYDQPALPLDPRQHPGVSLIHQGPAEIPVCPETRQNLPESSGPWFARDAVAEAERADTVDELMELVRVMAAAVLTPQQTVIFRLCYQEQRTQVERPRSGRASLGI